MNSLTDVVGRCIGALGKARAAIAIGMKSKPKIGFSDGDNGNWKWRRMEMVVMEMAEMGNGLEMEILQMRHGIVFHISNCPEKYQVKYATCILLNSALTWWNSHKRTIRTEAAFAMSWRELMKLMTEVYYPRMRF
ncbi:hypothetical protein Tco_0331602 [Tanacetum coccineum]